jgi:hypothetical protein
MKKNVGKIDRIIRGLVAVAILLLYLTHQINGNIAAFFAIIALVMFLTSTLGFCPCYIRLNVNTLKKKRGGN